MRKLFYGIIFITLAIIVITAFPHLGNQSKVSQDSTIRIADQIASLPKMDVISGPKAIQEISRLHGKNINLAQGYTIRYGSDGKEVTVWISVSKSKDEANALFYSMDQRIPRSKIFTNRQKMQVGDTDVRKVLGMGQQHFYWVKDRYNYWVAVKGLDGILAVREVMQKIK